MFELYNLRGNGFNVSNVNKFYKLYMYCTMYNFIWLFFSFGIKKISLNSVWLCGVYLILKFCRIVYNLFTWKMSKNKAFLSINEIDDQAVLDFFLSRNNCLYFRNLIVCTLKRNFLIWANKAHNFQKLDHFLIKKKSKSQVFDFVNYRWNMKAPIVFFSFITFFE